MQRFALRTIEAAAKQKLKTDIFVFHWNSPISNHNESLDSMVFNSSIINILSKHLKLLNGLSDCLLGNVCGIVYSSLFIMKLRVKKNWVLLELGDAILALRSRWCWGFVLCFYYNLRRFNRSTSELSTSFWVVNLSKKVYFGLHRITCIR